MMKICPLRSWPQGMVECCEDECAWWDDADELCAIMALSINLAGLENYVMNRLFNIAEDYEQK